MGAGSGVCMDGPAAAPGCTPKPSQGCEQWDAGAKDECSSFQLQPEPRSDARGQGRARGAVRVDAPAPALRLAVQQREGMCRDWPGGSREGVERVIRAGGCESANDA